MGCSREREIVPYLLHMLHRATRCSPTSTCGYVLLLEMEILWKQNPEQRINV